GGAARAVHSRRRHRHLPPAPGHRERRHLRHAGGRDWLREPDRLERARRPAEEGAPRRAPARGPGRGAARGQGGARARAAPRGPLPDAWPARNLEPRCPLTSHRKEASMKKVKKAAPRKPAKKADARKAAPRKKAVKPIPP